MGRIIVDGKNIYIFSLPFISISNKQLFYVNLGLPGGAEVKASACSVGDWVRSLGQEDPLEKETATHYSTLAWRIPWREESGRLLVHGVAESDTTE